MEPFRFSWKIDHESFRTRQALPFRTDDDDGNDDNDDGNDDDDDGNDDNNDGNDDGDDG